MPDPRERREYMGDRGYQPKAGAGEPTKPPTNPPNQGTSGRPLPSYEDTGKEADRPDVAAHRNRLAKAHAKQQLESFEGDSLEDWRCPKCNALIQGRRGLRRVCPLDDCDWYDPLFIEATDGQPPFPLAQRDIDDCHPLTTGDIYDDCHKVGGMSRYAYEDDPKRLAFTAARYKHVAKLLEGKKRVLEVGCSDGYFSRIVAQHVEHLTAIDVDRQSINEARQNQSHSKWYIHFEVGNILPTPGGSFFHHSFDAVYALDVLEHIRPDDNFLKALHLAAPVAVIGTPSLESQKYASKQSVEGHVNCYGGEHLKDCLSHYWDHVFMFTMHDEALGTGFLPMANYLLALCVRK